MSVKIRFGTDGWRGLIAEDYTFGNVRRCAQGFAAYLLNQGYRGESVVVGFDKRCHSENFASACAEVLAANGMKVYLTDGATPTPCYLLFCGCQAGCRCDQYHCFSQPSNR